jgi:hypothetical protein
MTRKKSRATKRNSPGGPAAARNRRVRRRPKQFKCDVCSRTDAHIHCPECGSTEHVAENCDMECEY